MDEVDHRRRESRFAVEPALNSQSVLSAAEQELGPGFAEALGARFEGAASHFTRARDLLADEDDPLRESLDRFLDAYAQHWQSQGALHDASRRFAASSARLQDMLAEIQHAMPPQIAAQLTTRQAGAPTLRTAATGPARREPSRLAVDEPDLGLTMTCFGRFAVWRDGIPLQLCPNRSGQVMLRYLAAHPRHRETSDVLMEMLWPEESPDRARHRLHCAASALRGALNVGAGLSRKEPGYLLYQDGAYSLNPALRIRIDSDDFVAHYEAGRRLGGAAAIAEYEAACRLCTGTFLADDRYAEWCGARRERLSQILVSMYVAIARHHAEAGRHDRAADAAQRILDENRCDEAAFRVLIRARALSGNRPEAIRQYERCKAVLAAEVGVTPMPATTALFHAVLRNDVDLDADSSDVEQA